MSLSKNNILLATYIVFSLFYIALAIYLPVSIYAGAGLDDAWFITNAERISNGDWLGNFNHTTLIKGPAYSYFLYLNHLLGLPITFSIAFLYIVSCVVLVSMLKRAGLGFLLSIILFILMLFLPSLFPVRIIRDNIYYSLTLLTFSGILYIVIKKKVKILYFAPLGIATGLFWITREEGIWILPGLMLLIIYGFIIRYKERLELISFIKNLAIFLIFATFPTITTSFINYSKYSIFQVVDFKDSEFKAALNALNSVIVGEEVPFVPVSKKKREAIYKVSPAFQELEPYFEDRGKGWISYGCKERAQSCGDYAGGWFMWALREGVGDLGYYSNPQKSSEYFSRLTKEVKSACEKGELTCSSNPISYMPKLTYDSFNLLPKAIFNAIDITLSRNDIRIDGELSTGPFERLMEIKEFLGNPRIIWPKNNDKILVLGWYYQPAGKWISLSCNANEVNYQQEVERQYSADITAHFNDQSAIYQRFAIEVNKYDGCIIKFDNDEYNSIKIRKISNRKKDFLDKEIATKGGILYIDEVNIISQNTPDKATIIKKYLIDIYGNISIFIFAIGLISLFYLLFLFFLKKNRLTSLDSLFVIAISLWILYFSRIILVALVDILSFAAVGFLYLMPAFPILFAASFVSFASVINSKKNGGIK